MSRGHVYGPVPSRRLGISLGIDPIPKLVCTFDCIYCQLGRNKRKVAHWSELDEAEAGAEAEFPTPRELLREVEEALEKYEAIDCITVSGSGEPTLNPRLGELAELLRQKTDVPLALITNSSLLIHDEVLEAAKRFDLVLPTLDAGDQATFHWVNRPAPGFDIHEIAEAIRRLVIEGAGEVWLEVMLVKSRGEGAKTNYNPDSIAKIIEKLRLISPHEVHLNTAVRPPAEEWVEPLTPLELERVKLQMERELPRQVIKVVPQRTARRSRLLREGESLEEIYKLLSIRPCTIAEIVSVTGLNPSEVRESLERLLEEGRGLKSERDGEEYYMACHAGQGQGQGQGQAGAGDG